MGSRCSLYTAEIKTLYSVFICFTEDLFTLTSNSEDLHMRSIRYGNGRSSEQIFIGVSLFLMFLAKGKVKNAFNSN